MGKRKRKKMSVPIMMRRNQVPKKGKPLHEMSEKEFQDKIRELEYKRIKLPKYPSIRRVFLEERLTQEINIIRKKIEAKQKENSNGKA